MGEKQARDDDDDDSSATSVEETAVRNTKRQRRPRGRPWCRWSATQDARKRRRRVLKLQERARQKRHAEWTQYWRSQRVAYSAKAIAAAWAVGRGRGVPAQLDAVRLGRGTVHFTLQCHRGGGSGAETLLLASSAAAATPGIQGGATGMAAEPTPVRIAAGRAFVNLGALATKAAAVVRAVHAAAAALPPPACAADRYPPPPGTSSDRPEQQQQLPAEESVVVDFTEGQTTTPLPTVTMTLTPPRAAAGGKRRRPDHRPGAATRCLVLAAPPPGTVSPSSLQCV